MAFSRTSPRHQLVCEIAGFGVITQQQDARWVPDPLRKVADSGPTNLMGDMYRWRTQYSLSKIDALRQVQIALALSLGQHTHSSGFCLY
ncbi:MAG: hypothetical protein ACOVS5_08840 [Oligoflexus sp.]|jgi:hypothetical protein